MGGISTSDHVICTTQTHLLFTDTHANQHTTQMHIKEVMGSYFKNIVTHSSLIICTDDTQDHTWTVHFYSALILMRFEDLVPMTMSNAVGPDYTLCNNWHLGIKCESKIHWNFTFALQFWVEIHDTQLSS